MTHKDLPAPSRSNKQVQEYVAAVKKGSRAQFVVPTGAGWSVRPATSKHAGSHFETQEEAMAAATAVAQQDHGEVFVFDGSGELVR